MAVMFWALLLFSGTLSSVAGYRNGKVEKSCGNMVPRHSGQHNTTSSPYTMSVSVRTFTPGDHITVTLSGRQNFEGFMIEARNTADPEGAAVGSFSLTRPEISQLLHCNNIQGSAVSHTSGEKKTEVSVVWIAPANAPASVHFLATVVDHYSNFWVKIPSPVISQSGATHPTQISVSNSTTVTTTILPRRFSSEGCGQWKSCLMDPDHCDPASDTHCFFLSYRTEGGSVWFELSGPAQGYVSFALSLDRWMGNDDVYLCVKDGMRVNVDAAYATGRSYPEISYKTVLKDVGWRVADGVIQCRFRRTIDVPQDPQRFKLEHSYYLFIAHGNAQSGHIYKHQRQPLVSAKQQVITGPSQILTGSRSPLIMKYHGALMLLAWMVTGCTGIFIAAFLKQDWPEKTLFGQRIWFQVHRGLMMLTAILTFMGFVLPFVYRGHWNREAAYHADMGIMVMAFVVIQPIMAAFRPAPESSRRRIFNWLHWGVGYFAEMFAVGAMFAGVRLESLLLPYTTATGVLAGFVVWLVLSKLLLIVQRRGLFERGGNRPDEHAILDDPAVSRNWDSRVKLLILAVFAGVSLLFCIALLCSISAV
ncbi:putative ferric-chelate reductase 1 [Hoplias malabaricus]|uniref:putative ferric-chelate reductase 1 n=1 Tax=Hoplias malabaricus TaxID=27720 RepID=UPI0034618077